MDRLREWGHWRLMSRMMRLLPLSPRSHWCNSRCRGRLRMYLWIKVASWRSHTMVEISWKVVSWRRDDIALISTRRRGHQLSLVGSHNRCHAVLISNSPHVLPMPSAKPPDHSTSSTQTTEDDHGYGNGDPDGHTRCL